MNYLIMVLNASVGAALTIAALACMVDLIDTANKARDCHVDYADNQPVKEAARDLRDKHRRVYGDIGYFWLWFVLATVAWLTLYYVASNDGCHINIVLPEHP